MVDGWVTCLRGQGDTKCTYELPVVREAYGRSQMKGGVEPIWSPNGREHVNWFDELRQTVAE